MYTGPNTATNGLVLSLDAANPKSYVSGSATWRDLTGNGNNFTLINSPFYDGTKLSFDGTTQYGSCVNTTFGNFGTGSFTLEYVYYTDGTASNIYASPIMKRKSVTTIGGLTGEGWVDRIFANLFFAQDTNPTTNRANALEISYTTPLNKINHVVQVISKDSTGFLVTGSTYINNTVVATATRTWIGNGSVDNPFSAWIMRSNGEGGYLSGSMYMVRAYNRALSAAEIFQNYNSQKSRFGL